MNAQVLNNPLAQFHHNKQMTITRAKGHANLKWGRVQIAKGDTPKVLKPTLIMLTSNTILELLGMIAWGLKSIPFNV